MISLEPTPLPSFRSLDSEEPGPARLHETFEEQADRTPEAPALVSADLSLTYRELEARANRLAHHLISLGVGPEVRVGVFLGRSAETVVSILAVLKAGGAYVPLDPAYPAERVAFMLEDSRAAGVLTDESRRSALPPGPGWIVSLDADARALADRPASRPLPGGLPDGLAYVIYTSGSTGRPKGVMIRHRSAAGLVAWARQVFTLEELEGVLAATSFCFDLSVFELFVPLSRGGTVILARDALALPEAAWLRPVTLVNTVPSAMAELLRSGAVPPSVRTVNLAGEALPGALVDGLYRAGVERVFNLYGPSEDTTYSTFALIPPGSAHPPIGRPVANTRAWVLVAGPEIDPRQVAAGEEGDLYLGGEGLARGYLDRPDLTAERFVPDPWAASPGERLYRTGDLVRRLPGGDLLYLGRIDQQVKIRGFRIELGEVEAALSRHPSVREAAVAALEGPSGERRLVGFLVAEPGLEIPPARELRRSLRRSLPEPMVPPAFTVVPALPRTVNGKLDRAALTALQGESTGAGAAFVAPRTPVEERLAGFWRELLGVEDVGVHDDFFELGGHSLLATRLVSRLREGLGVELSGAEVLGHPTVASLAARLETLASGERGAASSSFAPIEPVDHEGELPLSLMQEQFFFLDRLAPGLPAYDLPAAWRLAGALDEAALERAFGEVLRRHEALRAVFGLRDDGPVQRVLPPAPFTLPRIDLRALPAVAREAESRRLLREEAGWRFDLLRGPLLRAVLIHLEGDHPAVHALAVNIHHIAADGWSLSLLAHELRELYGAFRQGALPSLPALPVQYGDFAVWQRRWLTQELLAPHLAYWRERLAGIVPLDLPADRPRPPVQTFRGRTLVLTVPAALKEGVARLARQVGATPFMALLAGFQTLLHRLTGAADVVVGVPVALRGRREVEDLIGLFVNTLVLRADFTQGEAMGFRDLLAQARQTALEAYAHQDLPGERLVEELQPVRDLSRNPLVQQMFQLLDDAEPLALADVAVEPLPVDNGTAQFDLGLTLTEEAGGWTGRLESSSDLFDETTVRRWAEHYLRLLAEAVAGPDRAVADLPLLAPAERHQVLVEWNDTGEALAPLTVPERLAERAAIAPDAVAVRFADESLTYGELIRRARRLAARLTAQGAGPEGVVGLAVERSPALVIGLLGIWEAGAAYLPLDPSHPAERLALLLEDAGTGLVVTEEPVRERLALPRERAVLLEEETPLPDSPFPVPARSGGALAYVIYTSGSTGTPKGVRVEHGNLARILAACQAELGFHAGDVMAVLAPYSFDIFLFELLSPLLAGGTAVLVPSRPALDIRKVVSLLPELTRLHAVPSLMRQIVAAARWLPPASRRPATLFVGGDAVPADLLSEMRQTFPEAGVRVLYGPTEATILASSQRVGEASSLPQAPLGRPLPGVELRVADGRGRPQPIGVPGEIWIGGAGVTRGYLGRDELTAERFPMVDGRRWYRTGDLGRWLAGGNLEFLGRVDGQVKVRGVRIEPGEIEAALLAHPAVREAAVLAQEEPGGDRRLVAYLEAPAGETDAAGLRAFLQGRLPGAMIPSLFVLLPTLPLTATGKVDRRALAALAPAAAPDLPVASFATPTEEVLAVIWADLLGLDRVGAAGHFFYLGGHSLLAYRLLSRVRESFGVDLPIRTLFESPTVAGFAARLDEALRSGRARGLPPVTPVGARTGDLPLSFSQQRLFFLDRLMPGNPAYNLPVGFRLAGPVAPAALEAGLGEIVRRHEVLRTAFALVKDGEEERAVQRVAPPASFLLPRVDLEGLPPGVRETELLRQAAAEARQPFDLLRGPVFRAVLLRLGEEDHALFLNFHHIATDAWSLEVMLRELSLLYGAVVAGLPSPLPELPVQYADFAVWQRRWLAGEALEAHARWWKERLAGAPVVLELPADRPRPAVQSHRGGAFTMPLPRGLGDGLARLARRHGATLYMTLLAGFQTLLARLSGQDDLLVGSPVANRGRREVEGLIGFFVNTLVLRGGLAGDPGFLGALARVRETALGAYAHQELPFERLVEELQPVRDTSRNPILQVLFQLLPAEAPPFALAGAETRLLSRGSGSVRFDLETAVVTGGNGGLVADVEYARDLFDAPTVLRFFEQYGRLLEGVLADPERRLSEIPLLGEAGEHQVLREWNDTAAPAPAARRLQEVFEAQAARTPAAVAVTSAGRSLTYCELEAGANRLARHLQALGVGPETRVGIFLERSVDLVLAVLGVLKAGGTYLPLDPAYPRERLAFMLADAGAAGAVTQESLAGALPPVPWVVRLDRDGEALSRWEATPPPCPAEPEGVAYLIYTSGSTGTPKGVAIRHRAAAEMLAWAGGVFSPERAAATLASTSISFDLSVFEIFLPLCRGGRAVLVRDALALAGLQEEVTLVNTVPSAMTELVRTGALPASVTTIGLAGEALPGSLVDGIHRLPALPATGARQVFNLYGPSEDTTYSTFTRIDPGTPFPAIGRPIANTRGYVLDRALQPVSPGVAGELFLAGEGLARGYLGRPGLTAERFVPDPWSAAPGGRLYRTGDLVRALPDGSLRLLGRLDHQVKVRGFRIELGEVEAALLRHPAVREAVAAVREEAPGAKRLVAYLAASAELEPGEVRDFLRRTLPEPVLPSAFVVLPELPHTPNGKVDRKALPAPGFESRGAGEPAAPRTPTEEVVAGIWTAVLGIERLGVHDNFFDLGGHSLLAYRLLSRVRESCGVELPIRALFEAPTLQGFATRVNEAARGQGLPPVTPASRPPVDGELPLSFSQQRLLFLDRLMPGNPVYNLPLGFRIAGPLDVPALEKALGEIVRRHEVLRTSFGLADERAFQRVAPPAPLPLPRADLRGLPPSVREAELLRQAAAEARQPFDLLAGPVFRALLLQMADGDHALLLNLHHIATDAWSLDVMLRELSALYGAFARGLASPLPELPVQYADYAAWQRRWLAGEALEAQAGWWKERLAGAPMVLELPPDRPRPAVQTHRGATLAIPLPAGLEEGLTRLGRGAGATLFMTLLAGFQGLLARLSGQDDVLVASPIANRGRREVEGLIGFFVNTLVLRARFADDPVFGALLARVREAALGAYAHQDLPFERLVEELQPERDTSRNPIAQVMFQLLAEADTPLDLAGAEVRALPRDSGAARMDLELAVVRSDGALIAFAEYATDLFDAVTILRLVEQYGRLLEAVVADPGRRLSEIPLLGEAGAHQLLHEWNDTARPAPAAGRLQEVFEAQAARTPTATALVAAGRSITYGELEAAANRLARHLQSRGVGPEARVGIFLDRSVDLVVSVLGVLKAGGAYLPLDPAYPRERLAFMLADAAAAGAVTRGDLAGSLPPVPWTVHLDRDQETLAAEDGIRPPCAAEPESLAYVIYTSGSTGRPKGVAIRHRAAAEMVAWAGEVFSPAMTAAALASTSICFDLSVFELFLPLSQGGRVVLVRDALALASAETGAGEGVTLVNTVPSAMTRLVQAGAVPASVTTVGLAGEPLPGALVDAIHGLPGGENRRVFNLYGPSEDTTYSTWALVRPGTRLPPIGRPVSNTRAYVVDRAFQPVPPGVAGELCLGGEGLARGYLGRPELTAERFVPDPWSGTAAGAGSRLYRTGDLVRTLPDGELRLLGRLDHQVKVRGFRIELGEVEAALLGHPAVLEAVVVAREDTPGEKRLAAYLATAGTPVATLEDSELRELLRRTLPEYMVPSAFVVLPELPHTPNGKVDRKALPPPDLESRPAGGEPREPVAPRTPTEAGLVKIWKKVLGIERLGVQDSFFDVGGHSLLALHVVTRIRGQFGLDLPLAAMFRAPTIEAMAALIDGQAPAVTSPVILMGGAGIPKTPFFCVHGVGGNVFRLRELSQLLGRPFYGVQGWSDLKDISYLGSVDAMVSRYLEEVRKVQPEGPYLLGGICVGCHIAFEMARRLTADGRTVAHLVFLDTQAGGQADGALDFASLEAAVADELGIPIARQKLLALPPEGRLEYLVREGRRSQALPPGFTTADARRYIDVFRLNLNAWNEHRPTPWEVRATLFAGEGLEDDPSAGWGAYALGGCGFVEVTGDHATMLRSPHVEGLAAKLARVLDGEEARLRG